MSFDRPADHTRFWKTAELIDTESHGKYHEQGFSIYKLCI